MRWPSQSVFHVRVGLAVGALLLAAPLVDSAAGAPADAPDLGYAKSISWHLDDAPDLADMEPTIRAVLARVHVTYAGVDGTPVEGFFPGMTYQYRQVPGSTPFYIYIRDTATVLPTARYYYGAAALRSVVEEFLRLQYADGAISATVSPDDAVDKATVVSDEETSEILAAAEAVRGLGDPGWLKQPIHDQAVIERLNRAMGWLLAQRLDPDTRLIKRAHTTDWGDVKWEMSGPDPTHMQPGDQWTVSIYDQAIAYAALRALARLNAAVGRDQDAADWQAEADDLRQATNAVLWQDEPERGYYRIHVHLAPDTIQHQYDEGAIVAIGNAAAVYYGLATTDQVPRILAALERARLAAPAPKPGLTLEPAYPDWHQVQMDQRVYQNGALWDWWAGRQISAEFWSGYSSLAREHLLAVARDWATHPGRVREWESPWLGRTGAEQAYGGAASVVGQAVVEGLFGVDLSGRSLRLSPRLGDRGGGVRVYSPATDVYVAYEYQPGERQVSVRYGTNSPTTVTLRLQVGWRGDSVARLDGQDVLPISYEQLGEERVARVIVPSGTHAVDLRRAPPRREAF